MEFPDPPYSPVPVNGFQYPSVEDLEEHVRERGTGDCNLMRMWLPDQIWTQNRVERLRRGSRGPLQSRRIGEGGLAFEGCALEGRSYHHKAGGED